MLQLPGDRQIGQQGRVTISMDGRGRCLVNIFVERLWRSLKYEDIYIKGYERMPEARHGLALYFDFYNDQRLHQALDDRTRQSVWVGDAQRRCKRDARAGVALAISNPVRTSLVRSVLYQMAVKDDIDGPQIALDAVVRPIY